MKVLTSLIYLSLKRQPEIKKNNASWNEYGVNIPRSENSKCPETTNKIASAFSKFISFEKILSIRSY